MTPQKDKNLQIGYLVELQAISPTILFLGASVLKDLYDVSISYSIGDIEDG